MKKKPDSEILSATEKKCKDLLEASEERYRTFFENSIDAILITSQDGSVHSANASACKMFGYSEDEFCILRRENIAFQTAQLSEALAERQITGKFFGELTFIKKDGTKFPVEISSSVFIDTNGKELTSIIIRDITDRKKLEREHKLTEESLIESRSLLNSIIDSTNDLIWSVDPVDFKLLTFNKALEYLFKKENIIIKAGVLLNEILPRELAEKLTDLYEQTLIKGTLFTEYQTTLGDLTLLMSLNVVYRNDKPQAISVFAKDITQIKKSESEIRQARDWQERIFEGSIDAIFISDCDSRLIAVNKAACDLTGYTRDQLHGMRIPDLHEEMDLGAYNRYHDRILKGERILSEAKILRADGSKVDAEFNNSRIIISDKIYMHTTARDLTERRKTETELHQSEERFRNLFENSVIGISTATTDGRLLLANRALARMYGYENEEKMLAEVKDVGQLYVDPGRRKELLATIKSSGVIDSEEVEMIRKDHSKFFVLVSVREVKDSEENLLYTIGTHLDITERKKSEQEIRSASLYVRSLIEASLDPLVTINADGKITDVNLATEKITGVSRKQLTGSDFADYFTNHKKARKGLRTVFSKGFVKDYPLTMIHVNGYKADVLYNATLFKNEAGIVQGVFASARDITERKRIEEELMTSKELLGKLNQHLEEVRENERSQIALNLHDDLGQRLTAIGLDIAWLNARIGVQSQPVRKKITEIRAMINETIDSIKEISFSLRPGILYDLGLVPAFEWQLQKIENQTGIKCQLLSSEKEFNVDPRISLILFRILQESLTNIVRHSKATHVQVYLQKYKNKIEMTVKDNGIGIDEEKINSIRSMGISGIRERVASVLGEVTINGINGTSITVSIPLKRKIKKL